MALESFYGGKQGVSPVIKARFESREKLQKKFSDSTYKDVWFSELAIIDSPNKLNKDNGKVYRRTLPITTTSGTHDDDPNYAGPNAEYIGQIVGPAGGIPNVILTSLDNLKDKATGEETEIEINPENDQILFPKKDGTSWAESNNIISSADDFYITEGDIQQVPGQVNENTFNDKIKYSWFNLVKPATSDSEDNQIAYVYLGFEIPYPVFNFSIATLDYNKASKIEDESPKTEEKKDHPYVWNYKISIPRGIRGIWQEVNLGKIEDFYDIETQNWLNPNTIIYHSINDLIYDENSDSYNVPSNSETAALEDFKNGTVFKDKSTQFWYLKVQCPELSENTNNYDVIIKTYYFYLEDFKVLDKVNLNNRTGAIILTYNNGDTRIVEDTYTYVSNLSINSGDKALKISYHGKRPDTNAISGEYDNILDENNEFFIKDPNTSGRFYLNTIEDIHTDYNKNAFYILFSSNHYEPSNAGTTSGQQQENNFGLWTYKPSPKNDKDRWWYTISPIAETRQGVRILTALTYLDDYLPKIEENEDEDKEQAILEALNSEDSVDHWDNDEHSNPYKNGQNGHGGNMDGQFGIYGGYAFYYDKLSKNGAGEWKSIGSWADSASSSREIYLDDDDKRSTDYSIGLYFSDPNIINNEINWPNLEL